MSLFITNLWERPILFFMTLFVVIFSVCLHEYCHAQMALWQGDNTAANRGHLTLNPLKQMGIFSLIMFIFVGLAWGAVPVDRRNFKHKYSEAIVSFAGPAVNILLFFAFSLAFSLVVFFGSGSNPAVVKAALLFKIGAVINFVLFIINMLPVPPLDGWGIYATLFPKFEEIGKSEFGKVMLIGTFIAVFYFAEKLFELGSWSLYTVEWGLSSFLSLFTG